MMNEAAKTALQQALETRVAFDVPMARHTSLRVGGPADVLATPETREDLAELLAACKTHGLAHICLGAGFNTLVGDEGIRGVVISLRKLRAVTVEGSDAIRAEAGASHNSVMKFCVDQGRGGLEFGAGIPGTVGGWVTMNAGIGSREIVDVVLEIEVMSASQREAVTLQASELDFTYRALGGLPAGAVIVSALFSTSPSSPADVKAEIDRMLAARSDTQPLNVPSCGSVFKNPSGDFAGRLIEAAGLKGLRVGGAEISTVHANFITNTGGATATDVQALIRSAQEEVERKSGVRLVPEVRVIGGSI
jgi:UDP-N-acetylmuramate dehydrogenase